MLDIDRSTLFLNFTVTILICIVFVLMLWYQHRNRYQGLFVLLLSYMLNSTSVALIFLQRNDRGFLFYYFVEYTDHDSHVLYAFGA